MPTSLNQIHNAPKKLYSCLVRKEHMKSLSHICLTQDQATKLMSKQKKQNLQKPCPPCSCNKLGKDDPLDQVKTITPILCKSAPGPPPLS